MITLDVLPLISYRVNRDDYAKMSRIWPSEAKRYKNILKAAQQETPPAENVLKAGMLQALILGDRTLVDRIAALVEGNVPHEALAMRTGRALGVLGYYDDAIARIREAVERNPSLENRLYLAIYHGAKRHLAQKLVLARKILTDYPENVVANAMAAEVLVKYERETEAEPHIDKMLAMCPKDGLLRMLKGQVLFAREDYSGAIIQLKRALRHSNLKVFALLLVSLCYLCSGQYKKSRSAIKRALRSQPEAQDVKFIAQELDENHNNGIRHFLYLYNHTTAGLLAYEKQHCREKKERFLAMLFHGACLALQHNDVSLLKDAALDTQKELGEAYVLSVFGRTEFMLGQKADGFAKLRQAVRFDPSLEILTNLGFCLLSEDKGSAEGSDMLDRALELLKDNDLESPESARSLWSVGECGYFADSTLDMFRRMSRLFDNACWCLPFLGKYFYCHGKYPEALSTYAEAREAVNVNPVDISIGECRCYMNMNETDKAISMAERAIIEDPSSAEAQELLSHLKAGR